MQSEIPKKIEVSLAVRGLIKRKDRIWYLPNGEAIVDFLPTLPK